MMTPELTALAVAALVQFSQFGLFVVFANRDLGVQYTGGTRDFPAERALSKPAGRLQRALNNHFEGLIFFTIAIVVVTLGGASNVFTQFAAWAYVAARVLYVPAYFFGLNPWRSIIWFMGFGATFSMIFAALM